jgi:chemotaxis signal transduction protein
MGMEPIIKLVVAGRSVALRMEAVRQVIAARGIVPVPLTWPRVAGVVTLEGRAIPVYSLEEMDLPWSLTGAPGGAGAGARGAWEIVILEQEGALAGFLVERTEMVRTAEERAAPALEGRALLAIAGVIETAPSSATSARAAHGNS